MTKPTHRLVSDPSTPTLTLLEAGHHLSHQLADRRLVVTVLTIHNGEPAWTAIVHGELGDFSVTDDELAFSLNHEQKHSASFRITDNRFQHAILEGSRLALVQVDSGILIDDDPAT